MTIYEAQLTVQAGDETIWNGTVYARYHGIGGGSLDQVFFQPTAEIKRLLAGGGATP